MRGRDREHSREDIGNRMPDGGRLGSSSLGSPGSLSDLEYLAAPERLGETESHGEPAPPRRGDMSQGPVARGIVLFALPLIGASLVQLLYSAVDALFAGAVLGSDGVAAIGASSLAAICAVSFFSGLGVGGNVAVANRFGASDSAGVRRAAWASLTIALVGGFCIAIAGYLAAPSLSLAMNVPDRVFSSATLYLQVYFLSVPVIVVYNMLSGVLRGMGDSRTPLMAQIVGGAANVAFDALTLLVLDSGIAGIAWATFAAQAIACVVSVVKLRRRMGDGLPVLALGRGTRSACNPRDASGSNAARSPRDGRGSHDGCGFAPDLVTFKTILAVGVPCALQSLAVTLSNTFVQGTINGFGAAGIAAFTAYFKIEMLVYEPVVAFGQAATVFTAQNLGAGHHMRVHEGTRCCLALAAGSAVVTSSVLLAGAGPVFDAFVHDSSVAALGVSIAAATFPFYWLYAFVEVYAGASRGTGRATVPMAIILVCFALGRVVLLWATPLASLGVAGVAIVYPVTWLAAAVCMFGYYKFKVHPKLHEMLLGGEHLQTREAADREEGKAIGEGVS